MARVLGPLAVALDHGEVLVASQRERDVLALLVQRRGVLVSPEIVLDRVWQEAAVGLEPAAVHTVVARLRRRVGAEVVVTEVGRGYRLGRVDVDEDRYAARAADARTARLAGRLDDAVAALRDALALWRGETAYDGVTDQLVTSERARLDESRIRIVEELCGLLLRQPGADAAQEAYERAAVLATTHPLREEPYATLMWAAYRLRRPAEALAAFRDLRTRLRHELGVDPSPDLQALHQRVLDQDPSLDPSARAAAAPRRVAPVPAPLTETIGREDEIEAVMANITKGRRLVTITGPGGIGKTRVLHEAGARLAATWDVGYVDLNAVSDVSVGGLAEAVADAFGVDEVSGRDPVDGVAAGLASRRLLLLLDEAERVLEPAAELVQTLLDRCPGLAVVTTSRVSLRILGERVVMVGPLRCPAEDADRQTVLSAPAVRLFVARMLDLAPDLDVGGLDAVVLGEVARRVDGLPLGLVILAGHGATRSVPDLAALLDNPLDVAPVTRTAVSRHRSLRDTLTWSVGRLGPPERALFRRLGVFNNVIHPQAARAVVTAVDGVGPRDVEESLRLLVREGLLQLDRADSRLRYRMLRTVMDLAVGELDEAGEHERCTAAWRRWYAERWRDQPRSDAVLEDVDVFYDDYLDALDGALSDDPAAAVELLATLTRYWSFGHLRGVGMRWATRVLDVDGLTELDQARVRLARALLDSGSTGRSTADLDAAVPVLVAAGRWPDLVSAHMGLALGHSLSGRHDAAQQCARAAVAVARRVSDERLADALGVLSVVQADAEQAEDARATVAEARTLLRSISSVAARVAVASNLADALLNAGDSAAALQLVDEILPVGRQLGGRSTVDFLAATAGWANLLEGRARPALAHFRSVLVAVRGDLAGSRYAAEAALGAGCALAEVGDENAAEVLDLARGWVAEAGHVLAPAVRRRLDGLPVMAGAGVAMTLADPRDRLLEILERYQSS
ncbi:MAG TPA: BTAD domain-containing putative transcriptional regulator [Lapillicoccus sp.]|jgi:predicted ATPase/DNA-binding SARP family transcriptional activator